MTVDIHHELIVFVFCFLCGVLCSSIFDMMRSFRKVYNQSTIIVTIADLLFWAISCFICFFTIFRINSGILRIYEFVGLFFGSFLYFLTISKPIKNVFVYFFKFVEFIFKILLTPTCFLYKILVCIFIKIKTRLTHIFGGKNETNKIRKKNKKLKNHTKIGFIRKK